MQHDLNNIQKVLHFEHCVNLRYKYRFSPKTLLQTQRVLFRSARGYVVHLCARQFFYFFKKERKIRVIFFICRGCDILVLIFLFWIAKLKRLMFFVIFLYTINKNILGLQLFQDWDVYTGRSYYEAYASGPLIFRKQLF